jgi:hypothetical protein
LIGIGPTLSLAREVESSMRKMRAALLLTAGLCLGISGCGGSAAKSEAQFKDNFAEAVKAAEKGKELMKDAAPKR